MGLDPTVLPDAFLSKMDKADRKTLDKAGVTTAEAEAKQAFRREKELQERCIALLRLRGIFVNYSRTDKRKRDKTGVPDLVFCFKPQGWAYGIPCAWELKRPGEHPTVEQVKVMQQMMDNGWLIRVITSEEQMLECLKHLEAKAVNNV